ncbi:MAG: GNAT family N-acetyltransferase [Prosthecobacter sp.]
MMNVHEEAIEHLNSRGFWAKRRDWAPGATVIVSRGTRDIGGVEELDGMIILIWRKTHWDLQAPLSTPGGVIERRLSTGQACDRAIDYLQAPQDQVHRAFKAALRGVEGPTLEYWYPEGLPFHDGPYITEATMAGPSVAAQIHAVAQAAYALEADRIGVACDDFPPLRESLDELRQSSDSFLVFCAAGSIIGALSFDRTTNAVVITRLVVSPSHLRQGIAKALLAELVRRLTPGERLTVSTAQANAPALALYRRFGFKTTRASISAEGIPLVHLASSRVGSV